MSLMIEAVFYFTQTLKNVIILKLRFTIKNHA